ncbi:MAG: omptin family outer membrane protease [Treponema sp.]|jgi:outer membrane protease|nr:omptin family outer membrane protease [Treponema sp.]
MRNITAFLVLVIMACCAQFAAAQEKEASSYTFSSGARFGIFAGRAEEIVYPPGGSNNGAELYSQLLWDMMPVFYYGLSLDVSRARLMDMAGFFSTLSLKNAIHGGSGKMEDRDWLSAENNGLTGYSVHDNYTNGVFMLDLRAGLSIPVKRVLLIKPHINLTYMRFSFSGQFGEGKYARETGGWYSYIFAPIDDDPDIVSFSTREKVINYTQNWFVLSPGISVAYHFLNKFSAELFFSISPLIFCEDLDEHLTTGRQYRDIMHGGLLAEPGFRFSFIPNKRLEFSLDFSWRHIGGTRGATFISPVFTNDYVQDGEAGAGLSLTDTGLCLKISL